MSLKPCHSVSLELYRKAMQYDYLGRSEEMVIIYWELIKMCSKLCAKSFTFIA